MTEINRVSFIIPVLDSHEIVRRQLIYYNKILPDGWEMIIVDDGSDIPIEVPEGIDRISVKIIYTNDKMIWSQPRARNIGVDNSDGEMILMTDIDHFFDEKCIEFADKFTGDLLFFRREFGIIDENSRIVLDDDVLVEYGLKPHDKGKPRGKIGYHCNSFVMSRRLFVDLLNGYDEKFCGRHGGDDKDLIYRYRDLLKEGKVDEQVFCPHTSYVFPDPNRDIKHLFHSLRRKKK